VSAAEPVSVPERVSAPELRLAVCAADIVELAALRGRAGEIGDIANEHGRQLPALGRVALGADHLTLCVRPQRWLLLAAPASPGATAAHWQAACAGVGAAIDLSGAMQALYLTGSDTRELLVRSCRLDLSADAFPPASAAATLMVQVSVILAALPSGVLLLTPASTARHLCEWLAATARSFGSMALSQGELGVTTVPELTGDRL